MKPFGLAASILTLAAGALLAPARTFANGPAPDGPEIDCAGQPERWMITPGGGPTGSLVPTVTWFLARDSAARMNRIAPGLPPPSCFTGPFADRPGMFSINRAITTWNNAAYPGIGSPGSIWNMRIAPLPAGVVLQDTSLALSVMNPLDGLNVISMLEPGSTFVPLGFPFAVTFVSLNPVNNQILDADIAVDLDYQAVDAGAVPFWRGIENNVALGAVYASAAVLPVPAPPFPEGFNFDLQGTFTRGLGFLLGLAQSGVESEHGGPTSLMPVMFPNVPGENWPWGGPGLASTGSATTCTTGAATMPLALWGRSAQTLKHDDLSALGANYPTATYQTMLGAIEGRVTFDRLGTLPFAAAHVIAIKTDEADVVRIGAIQGPSGRYRLQGLPPGEYVVHCEPYDATGIVIGMPVIGGATATHFAYHGATGSLPAFADFNATVPCVGPWPYTPTEFYSPVESGGYAPCEGNISAQATVVPVVAGQTTFGIDIVSAVGDTPGTVGTGAMCCPACMCQGFLPPHPLWVGVLTGGTRFMSPRGMNLFTGTTNVQFLVATRVKPFPCGAEYPGYHVTLRFSTELQAVLDPNGEEDQLAGTIVTVGWPTTPVIGATGMSLTTLAAFPPAGLLPPGTAHARVFVQATYSSPDGSHSRRTNIVTVNMP